MRPLPGCTPPLTPPAHGWLPPLLPPPPPPAAGRPQNPLPTGAGRCWCPRRPGRVPASATPSRPPCRRLPRPAPPAAPAGPSSTAQDQTCSGRRLPPTQSSVVWSSARNPGELHTAPQLAGNTPFQTGRTAPAALPWLAPGPTAPPPPPQPPGPPSPPVRSLPPHATPPGFVRPSSARPPAALQSQHEPSPCRPGPGKPLASPSPRPPWRSRLLPDVFFDAGPHLFW
mmetsp:Transcript_22878/g.51750  ORF Transcript_22878/g.51750 Transcript_22878/m.51750 type:complete len:227 (+) Transcript_22878:2280-2960(+)